MLHDYKVRLTYENEHNRRVRRRLLLSAPVVVLGISGLYAALASGESPPASESGGFSPPPSRLTVPLTLPETRTSAAPVLTDPPSSAAEDWDSQAEINVASVTTALTLPPDPPAQSIPEVDAAAVDALPSSVPDGPADTSLGDAEPALKDEAPAENWITHEIKDGDTLAQIFSDMGFSSRQLHSIINSSKSARKLARIKAGQKVRIRLGARNDILELVHEISPIRSLQILAADDGFEAREMKRQLEHRITHAYGTIKTSLFASAQKAGLSDNKTMELASIFGWDIDFALEIRAGDQFSVVYREDFLDGKKLRDGPILAAEFVNRGKHYRAVRYVDSNGRADYFTPEGKSVRKAFLRTPVKLARISSRFNLRRKHPILNRIRAHKGVDYAAPKGTPIRASGDGRIRFRGRKGGYGKTVIIEHGGGISTLYGHMSRYARNKRKGSRVKQGDLIGYIGRTGLASGYHLHYEFRVNGVHRNPLTVKLAPAKPIASHLKADFEHQIQPMIAQLDALSRTVLAKAP